MSKIKHSLKIELAIDAAIYKLRSKLLGESPQWTHITEMPCTPLWQTENYENQILCIPKKEPQKRPHLMSRRKRRQVTSTQFFISPDFEWHPNTTLQEFKTSNKKRLSIVIPK